MGDEQIVTMHTVCGDGEKTSFKVDHLIEQFIGVFDAFGTHFPYFTDISDNRLIVTPPIPYGVTVYLWYTFK